MLILVVGFHLVLLGVNAWFAIAPTPGRRTAALLALAGGPALGFASTVVQLVIGFETVSHVNPADKATILSNGISEAMNSFAFSLIFIVPIGACFVAGIVRMRRREKIASAS